MSQTSRMAGALTLIHLANDLAGRSEHEILVEALHIAAEASGWVAPQDVDAALARLGDPDAVVVWLTEQFGTVVELYREVDDL